MRQTALVLLIPLLSAAQSVNPQAASKPEDLGGLEGQVLDAATGAPVRKAAVALRSVDPGVNGIFSTSTDASGKFAMKDLEPGHYRMNVSHNGYVNGDYGARGPGRQGATISLGRAQKLTGLSVKLTAQGVVTGRVLDRDGDPV